MIIHEERASFSVRVGRVICFGLLGGGFVALLAIGSFAAGVTILRLIRDSRELLNPPPAKSAPCHDGSDEDELEDEEVAVG